VQADPHAQADFKQHLRPLLREVATAFPHASVEVWAVDESDVQAVLQDLLPNDEQVNNEAAQALVSLAPEVKETALANSKLNQEWLGSNLESNLKDQGWVMARIAPQISGLIRLDPAALEAEQNHLLAIWPEVSQEVTATEGSDIRHIDQSAEGASVQATQRIRASDQSTIENVKQNIRLT
jgi:hypothetical protein